MPKITPIDTSSQNPVYEKGILSTLKLARIRASNDDFLIQNFNLLKPYKLSPNKFNLKELSERKLPAKSLSKLEKKIWNYMEEGEKLRYEYKPDADRLIREMIKILPDKRTEKFILALIQHKRKHRNLMGRDLLKLKDISEYAVIDILRIMNEKNQNLHLDIFYFKGINVKSSQIAEYLLSNMPSNLKRNEFTDSFIEHYMHARLIENLLIKKIGVSKALIREYPVGFAYAVGRQRDARYLDDIAKIIEDHLHKPELLGILIWTLGRLRAKYLLEEISPKVYALYNKYQRIVPN